MSSTAFQSNAEHELIERIHQAGQDERRLPDLQSRRLHPYERGAARRPARREAARSSKCICRTPTRASRFDAIPISRTSPSAACSAWARSATSWPCAPRSSACRGRPDHRIDSRGASPGMDIRKIKKLIELLRSPASPRSRSRKARKPCASAACPPALPHAMPQYIRVPAWPPGADASSASPRRLPPPPKRAAARKPRPNEHVVTAPMVGTFYAAPSPGAKAFVEIGDEVKVGQVLCIIEAMKMMNQIEVRQGRPRHLDHGPATATRSSSASRCSSSNSPPCSRRSSSPTVARSRCESCARAASSASRPSPCTPPPTTA